jgi:hypothetical protein
VRSQRNAPAALYPGKDPVPIVQEAGWAPGPIWTGAKNPVPTGIRSPDRPAPSQLLYRLRYPAHKLINKIKNIREISDFKKSYQPRTNIVKDEKGDSVTDSLRILAW